MARYITSKATNQIIATELPIGTFISNMVACTILAIVVVLLSTKQQGYEWVQPLLIVGFCGGYSTFSAFSNETFHLIDTGQTFIAILNVLLSVAVGVGLIFFIRAKS